MEAAETIALLFEVLFYLGLVMAVLCLIALLVVLAVDGRRVAVPAHLDRGPTGAVSALWVAQDGSPYSRLLTPDEAADTGTVDHATVYYSRRSPDSMRLHRRSEAATACGVLLLIAGALTIVSFLSSTALTIIAM